MDGEVYVAAPATQLYLRYSEQPITFDGSNHLDHVVEASHFPLVVSAMIDIVRTKILMDAGSVASTSFTRMLLTD